MWYWLLLSWCLVCYAVVVPVIRWVERTDPAELGYDPGEIGSPYGEEGDPVNAALLALFAPVFIPIVTVCYAGVLLDRHVWRLVMCGVRAAGWWILGQKPISHSCENSKEAANA